MGLGRESPDNEFIIYNENLQSLLNKKYFVKPKVDTRRKAIFYDQSRDIPAYRFPEMLYCTKCKKLRHYTAFNHQTKKQITCYCKDKNPVIPPRFVAVCEKGHIEDFPYSEWVHSGKGCTSSNTVKLSLFNVGGRTGIDSLKLKCENCGKIRGMQGVFEENALKNIKKCTGNMPWLEKNIGSECSETLKTRLRTATNVYFPVTVSALSIPPWSKKIFSVLRKNYDAIEDLFNLLNASPNKSKAYKNALKDQLLSKNTIKNIMEELPGSTIDEIIECYDILRMKKNNEEKTQKDIYQDEYKAITFKESNDLEFSSQFIEVPKTYKPIIDKVIAIDKLTEVVAMLGFTRINSWSGNINDENIALLSSKNYTWLPGVQLNGEGIFLQFNISKINEWGKSVKDYYEPMKENLKKSFYTNEKFSPEYILLHTFSHLLIRQLSLECGYGAASLKEKIYSTFSEGENNQQMAGILIYTAASDSDGSLGGLVEQSDSIKLGNIIDKMLDSAQWCSSDPLCINSFGKYGQGYESLNYAACHACTLLPETSCEFRNVLLDRGALIGRPDNEKLGFLNANNLR